MSADIITNLHLDKYYEGNRIFTVQEINGCDSSFIISCMLGNCIRQNKAVLIISTHNSTQHYHNAGLKMNYNLQRYIDSQVIAFYNLGNECVNKLICNENVNLEDLFKNVKQKIQSLKEKNSSVNIIFDGVTHLFDLQWRIQEVNIFCKKILKEMETCDNSFVFFHCNVASDDDVSRMMANLLAHKAYTVVEVGSLASGLSADVSGHLIISHPGQKFEQEHMFTMELKPSKYLFKLFDRGVKLFAPGTV